MRRTNKLKKIIETANIDWGKLMWCNIGDREELYVVLREELTGAQIDELYNAMPITITGNRFYEIDDFYDYIYYAITLSKRDVVDIDIRYGDTIQMN